MAVASGARAPRSCFACGAMANVALALVGVATCFFLAAWLLARSTKVGIGAPLISSDLGLDAIPPAALSDQALRLRGRPDLLLRERGRRRVYPVEVKPTRDSPTLYASDALQLAAYMVLTEATYGSEFAGYGIVRYRSGEFRVELTPDLKRRCLDVVEAVRAARQSVGVH